jgi:hypothetical protein
MSIVGFVVLIFIIFLICIFITKLFGPQLGPQITYAVWFFALIIILVVGATSFGLFDSGALTRHH